MRTNALLDTVAELWCNDSHVNAAQLLSVEQMNMVYLDASARGRRYISKALASATENYETEHFSYDATTQLLDCKLLSTNLYRPFFEQVYPLEIDDDDLDEEMLDIIRSYTDSRSNECYLKTNINLLSGNFDQIDWDYVNKLRSLIRSLHQSSTKPAYYRGLHLSDTEIRYYMDKRHESFYTNSFLSFTLDRLLIYPGNAILILKTDTSSEEAKANLANISKWSTFTDEKESLLAVGTKLKILSVHYFGYRWEIELELAEDTE